MLHPHDIARTRGEPQMKLSSTMLGILLAGSMVSPAFADGKAAGLPCTNSSNEIQTVPSDATDDVLACVKGTWYSMIHAAPPSGSIQAFNLSACPSGWVDVPALAGRTIIGAGQGNGLTYRAFGDYGGEERHVMTIGELVPHTVNFLFGASDKGGRGNGYAYSDGAGGSTVLATYWKSSDVIGGGQPFNVMPPFYTLLYCMKQ